MLPVFLFLLILLLLHDLIILDSFDKGVVVSGVVGQLAMRQPDGVRSDTVQEIL